MDENNPNYRSIDGNLYSKDGKILVAYAAGKKDSSFIIPEDVTSIGDSAFSGCSNLASIDIPEGVTSIGEAAFYECTNLASIDIPDVVTSIGASAFYRCTSLTSITIPDSVTNIGEAAFYGCTSLTSITIPDSVTSIGEFAFGSYDVGLTIYCEAIIEPSGWVYGWCSSNCYVFWGYKINKTT